jgi:hypothetical protein
MARALRLVQNTCVVGPQLVFAAKIVEYAVFLMQDSAGRHMGTKPRVEESARYTILFNLSLL